MMTKQQKEAYNKYILDSIDSEVYDIKTTTDQEKLQFLFDTFKKERQWEIDQSGFVNALISWFQGLPSVLNIEFENYKILELAKKVGTLDKNASDKQEDKILNNYWNFMAVKTIQLWNKYKIN